MILSQVPYSNLHFEFQNLETWTSKNKKNLPNLHPFILRNTNDICHVKENDDLIQSPKILIYNFMPFHSHKLFANATVNHNLTGFLQVFEISYHRYSPAI